jgi:bacterioferritin (cytochrome b1)
MSASTKVVRGATLRADPAREPCFRCVDLDSQMEGWPDMSDRARRERLHRHMNNELGALEIAAQCVADYPDAPWPLRMLLARQAADEARHASALLRRLVELGGEKGEFPVANYEWGVTMMLDDLPGRLAVQNRTFEAGLIDILGTMREVWREAGDDVTADVLDGILADEIVHVRFANRWIRSMTELEPRLLLKVAMAVHMLARTNAAVAIREGDVNAAGVPLEPQGAPAVNVHDRLAAEFTEDEVKEVLKQAGFRSILPQRLRD